MADLTAAKAVERLEALRAPAKADQERARQEALNILVLAANPRVKAAYLAALERLDHPG